MKLEELLKSLAFPLGPIQNDSYILEYLRNVYDDFDAKLECLVDNSQTKVIHRYRERINTFSEDILEVLKIYLNGQPAIAYHKLVESIIPIKYYFDRMKIGKKVSTVKSVFYRARKSEMILNHEDLFHVPYEYRYKVSSCRYSISGLPALYVSNMPYTCLVEADLIDQTMPDLGVNVSKVFAKNFDELKILDLFFDINGYVDHIEKANKTDPPFMKDLKSFYLEEISTRIINYPLIAACSIRKKTECSPYNFKEEYIVPQLLLQYVTQKESIDGIRYLSTRNLLGGGMENYQNFVFPTTKTNKRKGFCVYLTNRFQISNPMFYKNISDYCESDINDKISADLLNAKCLDVKP